MDLRKHLMAAGGIASRASLRSQGLVLADLPEWVKVYRGVLYLQDVVSVDEVRAKVYNGLVSCRSAAVIHGLPVLHGNDTRTHISVSAHRGMHISRHRLLDDVRVHRERGPIEEDPLRPWLASVDLTLRRAAVCCDPVEAVAMMDAARFKGLSDLSGITVAPCGPGTSRIRRAMEASRRGVRSILETAARMQLEEAGIAVRVAVQIPGVGEVDMVVFDRLIVETDGREHHQPWAQRELDMWRDRQLTAMGYLVVRFSYDDVFGAGNLVQEVLALREHALSMPAPSI
ncbi:DUF559 domain-containing protein [Schaalia sp. 19OD2882]|uniref:endonuclease domain-containing protein n=1 Tax=Schaalia sp. 19OD2882 TaxID=2794089 RepID=UPI001C1EDA0C|nr:DUF559 domain-containing protein [Schaalia sp. 19OD2882]QWW19474.1 DUF559 domain-containing protein [Schaalia sp. 19OD2882]